MFFCLEMWQVLTPREANQHCVRHVLVSVEVGHQSGDPHLCRIILWVDVLLHNYNQLGLIWALVLSSGIESLVQSSHV